MTPNHCRCGTPLDDRDLFGMCPECGRSGAWCPFARGHSGRCQKPDCATCPVCRRAVVYAVGTQLDVVALEMTTKVGGGYILYFEELSGAPNPPQRVQAIPEDYQGWPFPSWELHVCR